MGVGRWRNSRSPEKSTEERPTKRAMTPSREAAPAMSDTRMAWYSAAADLIQEDTNKNVAVTIPTHLGYGPLKASEETPSGARPYCVRRYEEFMVGMSYQNKYFEPETD